MKMLSSTQCLDSGDYDSSMQAQSEGADSRGRGADGARELCAPLSSLL